MKISKIKIILAASSFMAFCLPMIVGAQTPPPGILNITTNTLDDVVSSQTGPSYVFWYLISGYPSPSNPWLPVSTVNGTGSGTTKLAPGSYGIYQQSDYQDWKISAMDCSTASGSPPPDPIAGVGMAGVTISTDTQVDCLFANKYIANGDLKIVVKTDSGTGDFKFTLKHTDMEDKIVTVASQGTTGEKVTELHADVPSGTGSSTFLNSYTIEIGDSSSTTTSKLPPGWALSAVTCQRQDGSQIGTLNESSSAIFPVPVEAHKTTTCTFQLHQKTGILTIYSNLTSDTKTIGNIKDTEPDKQPLFVYQMGGFLNNTAGNLSIGAAGSFYYPMPYYIQLKVDHFPPAISGFKCTANTSGGGGTCEADPNGTATDCYEAGQNDCQPPTPPAPDKKDPPRIYTDKDAWAWGSQSVSVTPGIYYIQQNNTSGWIPSDMTCVQVYENGQTLIPALSGSASDPNPGDRIFIDEKGNRVNECYNNGTTNCCSTIIKKYYKDDTHNLIPPAQPNAPPLLNYGNAEKCSFGTTNPVNKQFNLSLSNSSMAGIPVAPGGKTICIFNNSPLTGGGSGRHSGNEIQEPQSVPNAEPGL